MRVLALAVVLIGAASLSRAHADPTAAAAAAAESLGPPALPTLRGGALVGFQRSDHSAWDFGPSLEVAVRDRLAIRGEALIEFGDFDDPFGPNNIIPGKGPHVNHVLFGPAWRPVHDRVYELAIGAEAGLSVLHSLFAAQHFTLGPAAGAFVQAGRVVGPVTLALQFRFDVSGEVAGGGPNGMAVPTTSGRINFTVEVPLYR